MLAHPANTGGVINTDLARQIGGMDQNEPAHHRVSFAESQHYIINPTNLRRALDNRVEHRLHVRRRAADDAEHLGVAV